jgi:hypothetical protein
MKTSANVNRYGVWIDRKHAMIIRINPDGNQQFTEILSGLGHRTRFQGETTNKTGMLGTTISWQKKAQAKENNEMRKFILKVVDALEHANAILILGSADTRFELQNTIEKNKQMTGAWIENRAEMKMDKRGLESEMEKHFNLHLG